MRLLPRARPALPWREALPRTPAGWAAVACLWLAFAWYVLRWTRGNHELLFDPWWQPDDARTALLPFHRFGPEHALADDPIANEMRAFVMPGMYLPYRALVPLLGVYRAVKAVQGLCLLVIAAASWVIARSRRGGLAPALLLAFLLLHTPYVANRLAGGFGRGFAFPLFGLWLAGVITAARRPRWIAALLGALTQPNTVALILGAEGLLALFEGRSSRSALGRSVARYGALVATCAALVVPYMASQGSTGRVHTLTEARANPAFGRSGRQGELPFPDPAPLFAQHLVSPFAKAGKPVTERLASAWASLDSSGPLLVLVLLALVAALRWAPLARAPLVFFASTAVLYLLARALAFRLYSPERYYSFGAPMAGIALAVTSVGLIAPRLKRARRAVVRGALSLAFAAALLVLAGDGIVPKNGVTIDRRTFAGLYDFAAKLPRDARLACHPLDGDDVPWWAARATTGGFETVQVWLVEPWLRSQARIEDVYRALYATDRAVVLDFVRRQHVTHLLLRPDRYDASFKRKVAFFEPLTSYAEHLVAPLTREQLVLAAPPPSAIVYRDRIFTVVEVAALERAWAEGK